MASILKQFSSITSSYRDLLPAQAARSFNEAIGFLAEQYDREEHLLLVQSLIDHKFNYSNPHRDKFVTDVKKDVYNELFNQHLSLSDNPMTKEEFFLWADSNPRLLIEFFRRVILNHKGKADLPSPRTITSDYYTFNTMPNEYKSNPIFYSDAGISDIIFEKSIVHEGYAPYLLNSPIWGRDGVFVKCQLKNVMNPAVFNDYNLVMTYYLNEVYPEQDASQEGDTVGYTNMLRDLVGWYDPCTTKTIRPSEDLSVTIPTTLFSIGDIETLTITQEISLIPLIRVTHNNGITTNVIDIEDSNITHIGFYITNSSISVYWINDGVLKTASMNSGITKLSNLNLYKRFKNYEGIHFSDFGVYTGLMTEDHQYQMMS